MFIVIIIIMDLPIFDITNIPHKRVCVADNLYMYTRDKYIINQSVVKQIEYLYKLNELSTLSGSEKMHFVNNSCDYDKINNIYKQYYKGNYDFVEYDKLTYLVMQKDTPIQIFIPEDKYTFLDEYYDLVLTIDNMNKLNNKIIKFSLYHNDKNSMLSKQLITRINECKNIHFIYWWMKDTFVADFVNELIKIMYGLLLHKHAFEYENMMGYYDNKFKGIVYGFPV